MTDGPDFQKYVEAGLVLGRVTKARAEEVLHELAEANGVQRERIEKLVDELVAHGRQAATGVLSMFRNEVETIFGESGAKSLDDLISRLGDLLSPSSSSGGPAETPLNGIAAEGAAGTAAPEVGEAGPPAAPGTKGTADPGAPPAPPTGTGS
jgi:hypothetical protein